MAYAFILALTGPAKNTLHNIGVLSESLACGQEQLKEAVKTIVDLVKQPFYALRDALAGVIKTIKIVAQRIKQALMAIKRMVLSIIKVITAVFEWLGSVVNICNKKLGTPFERCQKVFDGAVADCFAKLGPLFGGVCNLAYVVGTLCYIVKPLDFICILVSFVSDAIVGAIRKKIQKFAKHMRAMFYVKVDFSHSFHFETNKSKTLEEVATGIVTEIRSRTDKFLTLFDWMSFATSFFVLFMLLRVIHYRHKWLTNERFDNQYLTQDLRHIDLVRAKQDKETVLPLNPREKSKYIPLTSITLITAEKIHLTKSAVFLSLTTFKLCIHMMVDYSLYWILSTIRYHGRFETKVQQVNSVGMYVSGDGYLAQLYRSIVRAFSPSDANIEIDTLPCLPDPIPPDYDRYAQIGSLILICWIMTIFEPYGLRLRQVVMGYYHPERAKQRAVWLYNHIIRSRGGFIKFARRQLRRKFGMNGDKNIEKITFKERIMAMCPILHKFFPQDQKICLLCGAPERDEQTPHIKCPTPGCMGIFCPQCFADLQNLCTICKSPMEYGDMSDMSEEWDSSEDEPPRTFKKIHRMEETEEETEGLSTEFETPDVEKTSMDEETEEVREDISDSSEYSQSYQDEPPGRLIPLEKAGYRDVEAQRIRDDVTIQIFNEPLIGDSCDSSAEPTSCFVLRAYRKQRSRVRASCPCDEESSSSSQVNEDSDSSCESTQEIEEEEVLHIEVEDDGTRALVGAGGSELLRKKRGRVQRIVDALNRVSFIKNREGRGADGTIAGKRGSLTQRVIKMLQSRNSTACLPCQRGRRRSCSDGEYLEDSCDRPARKKRGKRSKSHPEGKHCCPDIYSLNWESHRERGGTDEASVSHPLAGDTRYYEVDETSTSPDRKEDPEVQMARSAKAVDVKKTGNVRRNERRQVPSREEYDPLAGLEIYGAGSRKPKRIFKEFPLIREETEVTSKENIDAEAEFPLNDNREPDEDLEPSEGLEEQQVEEATSLESITLESAPKRQSRGIFSEYSRKFRKKKKKCKKCKKSKDKNEQTEPKEKTPLATQTSCERHVCLSCGHHVPVCPGPRYSVEGWLQCDAFDDGGDYSSFDDDEGGECTCRDVRWDDEEFRRVPPQCYYREDTPPVMGRFRPECQCHAFVTESEVKEIIPRFVACQEIQTDPTSIPKLPNQQQPPKITTNLRKRKDNRQWSDSSSPLASHKNTSEVDSDDESTR
ncbi:uncharacterized protein LOC135162827 isoform X1 [Diachasmimorpha longicaudata]|uniref:uncharacterized protein LOC135162827 isoform X1 n=1 Tax=Diachasmimorpha longicaudata TaxID=58733 RepID=UPI0030B8B0B8